MKPLILLFLITFISNNHTAKGQLCDSVTIEDAIGIIVTNDNYRFGDTILVYNENQVVIRRIILNVENQILDLRCTSKTKFYYQVILENSDSGFISTNEFKVAFKTWQEHILGIFAVGFNQVSNPLRVDPLNTAEEITYQNDEFYHPNKIQDDWLQVKWGNESHWNYGWIKWYGGEKLLIELFYFA